MLRKLLVLALMASLAGLAPAAAGAAPKPGHHAPAQLAEPAPKPAPATPRATVVEVSVLHATHGKAARDPRIGEMPELGEKPFSSYESYELVSRTRLSLTKGGKHQLTLPNGRIVEARLQEVLPDASVRLVASINRPGVADFLPLLEVKAKPGQSFIVAGQSYKRGILVLVFKLVK